MYFRSSLGINNYWGYGSSTAIYMVIQVLTRLMLSMYVVILVDMSFRVVELLIENNVAIHHVRYLHANICSVVFILILIHASKRFWMRSYQKGNLWKSRSLLLILTIGVAFLRYVLPWGNMSLWGATVITNLLSVLPYGDIILLNIWAGYTICSATLRRIFSLHFLVPLLVVRAILLHLILLHEYVSSSSVVVNISMVEFVILLNKDVLIWVRWMVILLVIIMYPQYFIDADNWREANFLVTPDHIKPEWYFLFAYAILRCIPNKSIGVIRLVRSLVVVLLMGMLNLVNMVIIFLISFIILTWLRRLEVIRYYTSGSQYASLAYFIFVL
jgi:ubiquinol-cytochrome c reductase cytochrome b subunit